MLRNYNFYTVNKKIVAHIALSLLHALENQNSQQLSFDNLIILMHILCITHCVCMCGHFDWFYDRKEPMVCRTIIAVRVHYLRCSPCIYYNLQFYNLKRIILVYISLWFRETEIGSVQLHIMHVHISLFGYKHLPYSNSCASFVLLRIR